ncbi:hypothetical protein DFS33DRAFT_1382678 [Desarmillaria ectypa]|nr:hypothetical protein DFS33DRAFT_1382678 [Desarmillaria ectypa]
MLASQHQIRQLRLVIPGGLITYFFGTWKEIWEIQQQEQTWGRRVKVLWGNYCSDADDDYLCRTVALSSLFLGLTTIMLFFYVMLTPWRKGEEPNFRSWRKSGLLSTVIPLLTSSIVGGWLLLVVTLGHWSGLGYLKAIVAAITNNPFVIDPTNSENRFPDISGADHTNSQFTSWLQPGASSYQQQQEQQQQAGFLQQSPQYNLGYSSAGGYLSPVSPQQTSSFGQLWMGQPVVSGTQGSSYGYLQGQTAQSQTQAYNPAQQQLQNNPGYIAQFDPYSSLSQGWDGSTTNSTPTQQPPPPTPITPKSSTGFSHPREYLRTHKVELESWDTYAWKQLLGSFDVVKDAWEARKKELQNNIGQLQVQMQYGGGGYHPAQIQQEIMRLQGLIKEADFNFDSVAASSFQMHEVFQNYRQSGDLASKRRVREACNAALTALPDWPPQIY